MNENNSQIPKDIIDYIDSGKVYESLEKIANKYNIMLDQLGQLNVEVEKIMIGKTKSTDFIKEVAKNVEVTDEIAEKIAEDVNNDILNSIRTSLREVEERAESVQNIPSSLPTGTISAIEQAGDFTVENQPSSDSELYKDSTINKQAILNKIEEDHIPLVDHLLTTPISNPQKVEVKKPYTADPYREQM